MKARQFSEAMNEIDNKYINEAINYKKRAKSPQWIKWGTIAAGLCLTLLGTYLYRAEKRYPVKEVDTLTYDSNETYEIPKWEHMDIFDQYSEINVNGLKYQANRGIVPEEQLGIKLGATTASGWDSYADLSGENANRYCNATIYEIKNVAVSCAVAVQYEGSQTCYSAVNSSYHPETLEDFIKDLDLQNTMTINWASYEYQKPFGGLADIRFENLNADKVWDMLLSNTSAVNEYDDFNFNQSGKLIEISVSLPMLGYDNVSISVEKNGYIVTNILSTGKMFYIGEENTQTFVDYVLNDCDGYEIVYPSSDDGASTSE